MKKMFNSLLFTSILGVLLVFSAGSKAQAQDVTVSYQSFYDELSPYGQWVYDPDYGNVWVPYEDADFRPYYSRGRWAMTDYGNTWVSDDPWGWACYHYGRWTYNPYYGWVWIPGYEWAPAWVSWRWGGGYAGWAPLGPGISVGSSWGCPDSWWVFVGPQYLYRSNYYNYWRGVGYNRTYINQTTIINNVYVDNHTRVQYNFGPRASTIQSVTKAPVQVYRMSNGNRPGQSSIQQNTVSMYRPNVNRNTYTTARPTNVVQAPRNVGRPEAATQRGNGQPAFRQDIQRMNGNGNTGVVGPRGGQQQPQPGRGQVQQPSRFDNRGGSFDRNQGRQPEQRNNGRFDNRQPEPVRQPEPARQPEVRQPRFDQRDQPARQPEPVRQPEPQQPRVAPQVRPEPQRFQPERQPEPVRQPERQPEQPRYTPPQRQPERQPEQPRYNPPQRQPERQPEQPRYNPPAPAPRTPAPAPAPAPRQSAPERGGGRR